MLPLRSLEGASLNPFIMDDRSLRLTTQAPGHNMLDRLVSLAAPFEYTVKSKWKRVQANRIFKWQCFFPWNFDTYFLKKLRFLKYLSNQWYQENKDNIIRWNHVTIRVYSAGSGHFYLFIYLFPQEQMVCSSFSFSLFSTRSANIEIKVLCFKVQLLIKEVIYLYGKEWAKLIEHSYID